MPRRFLLLPLLLLASCSAPAPPQPRSAGHPKLLGVQADAAAAATKDGQEKVPLIVYMDVNRIKVPFGTISANEAFWKRIDENVVDVATYDTLYRNGLRVGVAPGAEWPY